MSCCLQRHRAPLRKLYLFHPSYTTVLLELRNSTDQIIAFTGKSPPCSPPVRSCRRTLVPPGPSGCCWVWRPVQAGKAEAGFPCAPRCSGAVRAEPPRLLRTAAGPPARRGARPRVPDEEEPEGGCGSEQGDLAAPHGGRGAVRPGPPLQDAIPEPRLSWPRSGERGEAALLCSPALDKPRACILMGSCLSSSANQSVAGREALPVSLWGQLPECPSSELMGLQCLATTEVSSAQGGGLSPPSLCACRAVLTQECVWRKTCTC